MLPKRITVPATLALVTLAGACHPEPSSNDPCTQLDPDCTQVEAADGGPVELPGDAGPECIC